MKLLSRSTSSLARSLRASAASGRSIFHTQSFYRTSPTFVNSITSTASNSLFSTNAATAEIVDNNEQEQKPWWWRQSYPPKKLYRVAQYSDIVFDPNLQFMICVQVNQDSESFTEFKKKLEEKHPDLQFKEVKNSLMSQVVLKGTKYSDLSALFVGPTSIVYHNNPETYFADAKALLSAIKKRKVKSDLITLGGIFQGQMVNFIQLEQMNQAISEVHVRSSLVDMLMSPSRNIIKILKSPLDGMVKALDFQAKKEGGEKAE